MELWGKSADSIYVLGERILSSGKFQNLVVLQGFRSACLTENTKHMGTCLWMVMRVIGYSHLKYEASYHPSIIFSQIYGLLFFFSVRVIVLLIEYFPYNQKF